MPTPIPSSTGLISGCGTPSSIRFPGVPESVCFKLYFDPVGIIEGQVTVVVDAPQTGSNRFTLGGGNGLIAADSRFDFDVVETLNVALGQEALRGQGPFHVEADGQLPTGPITLFGYQVQDSLPLQTVVGVQNSFEFIGNDFITVRNEDLTTTTFLESQLQDVALPLDVPLVLDVNTTTGAVRIRNASRATVGMTYYEVTSTAGSLNPTGWASIDDTEGGDPPGVGWDEAGGVDVNALSEANLTGSLAISSAQTVALGTAFDAGARLATCASFMEPRPDRLSSAWSTTARPVPSAPCLNRRRPGAWASSD